MTTAELTDFEALKGILGYTDDRSVMKWCREQKIPVLKMGFKRYISSHTLTQYIDNQLVIFGEAKSQAELIHKSIPRKYKPNNKLIETYISKYESDETPKAA